MAKKVRKLSDITNDMEKLLEELSYVHKLQHGEVLALVHIWLMIHSSGTRETYTVGGHPEFYYGPPKK